MLSTLALRFITVDKYDNSTCCGTHVKNTAELQSFSILLNSFEKSRPGCLRLSFLAGGRVHKAFVSSQLRDIQIGTVISCSPEEFPSRISSAILTSITQTKQIKRLEESLAASLGKELVSKLPQDEKEATKVISLHVDVPGTEVLQLIVGQIEEEKKSGLVFFVFISSPQIT
jgi:alanyl-tRNA synthetase